MKNITLERVILAIAFGSAVLFIALAVAFQSQADLVRAVVAGATGVTFWIAVLHAELWDTRRQVHFLERLREEEQKEIADQEARFAATIEGIERQLSAANGANGESGAEPQAEDRDGLIL